jgi:hypothetical protein
MNMETNVWEIISSSATLVQAIAVIIAILYAGKEIKNLSDERHLSLVIKFYELYNSPEAVKDRYHVYNTLPSDPTKVDRKDYESAKRTWRMMDQLGVIYNSDLASREFILRVFSERVSKLWFKLEPFILFLREERKYLAEDFEELAKICQDYRKDKFDEDEPYIYPPFDLPNENKEENELG